MDINKLDEELKECLNNYSLAANMRPLNFNTRDPLDGYDYDEICRQTFYVMDDFRQHIIKYLKSQK